MGRREGNNCAWLQPVNDRPTLDRKRNPTEPLVFSCVSNVADLMTKSERTAQDIPILRRGHNLISGIRVALTGKKCITFFGAPADHSSLIGLPVAKRAASNLAIADCNFVAGFWPGATFYVSAEP